MALVPPLGAVGAAWAAASGIAARSVGGLLLLGRRLRQGVRQHRTTLRLAAIAGACALLALLIRLAGAPPPIGLVLVVLISLPPAAFEARGVLARLGGRRRSASGLT